MTHPQQPTFRTRTDVLFASRSAMAVVLRRGPRKHFQLLLWHTDTDTFMPGQWMKGAIALCDLSPDGRKLIYFAAQEHASAPWRRQRQRITALSDDDDAEASDGFEPLTATSAYLTRLVKRRPKRKLPRYLTGPRAISANAPGLVRRREIAGTWTAVSTPPYFSALAVWPSNGRWTGGGYFTGSNSFVINESPDGMRPYVNVRIPPRIRIDRIGEAVIPPSIASSPRRIPMDVYDNVSAALRIDGATYVDWIYPAPGGDLLFACDGSIYRQRGWDGIAQAALLASADRLVDLTTNRFELISPPPEAMRW